MKNKKKTINKDISIIKEDENKCKLLEKEEDKIVNLNR